MLKELIKKFLIRNCDKDETIILLDPTDHKHYLPLKDKVIIIDPGHGLYPKLHPGKKVTYVFQRPKFNNILEDIINITLTKKLIPLLEDKGAKVICTRAYDNAEYGISGLPRWKESALMNFKQDGIIPSNFSTIGYSNIHKDINSRWQFANNVRQHMGCDLLISIHFNAGGGRGCEAFYFTGNEKTKMLATEMVNNTVRNNPGLNNRGAKPSKKYSILKRTQMNAIIWEGAFYDSKFDRSNFLNDERFYQRSALGIVKSVIDYYDT